MSVNRRNYDNAKKMFENLGTKVYVTPSYVDNEINGIFEKLLTNPLFDYETYFNEKKDKELKESVDKFDEMRKDALDKYAKEIVKQNCAIEGTDDERMINSCNEIKEIVKSMYDSKIENIDKERKEEKEKILKKFDMAKDEIRVLYLPTVSSIYYSDDMEHIMKQREKIAGRINEQSLNLLDNFIDGIKKSIELKKEAKLRKKIELEKEFELENNARYEKILQENGIVDTKDFYQIKSNINKLIKDDGEMPMVRRYFNERKSYLNDKEKRELERTIEVFENNIKKFDERKITVVSPEVLDQEDVDPEEFKINDKEILSTNPNLLPEGKKVDYNFHLYNKGDMKTIVTAKTHEYGEKLLSNPVVFFFVIVILAILIILGIILQFYILLCIITSIWVISIEKKEPEGNILYRILRVYFRSFIGPYYFFKHKKMFGTYIPFKYE